MSNNGNGAIYPQIFTKWNDILSIVTIILAHFKDVGIKVKRLEGVNSGQEWRSTLFFFWELKFLM
jgi:hypothetical protein